MSAATLSVPGPSLWQVFYSLATHLGRDATMASAVLDPPAELDAAPASRPSSVKAKQRVDRPSSPNGKPPKKSRRKPDSHATNKLDAVKVRPSTSVPIDAVATTSASPEDDGRLAQPDVFHWSAVIWIGLLHIGALAAPFFFSWTGFGLFLLFQFLTGIGVTLGYHRLLTHNSFQTHRWVRRTLAVLGALSGEGPPLFWVSYHRQHHAHSDHEHDPHSPRDGKWWSHMLWLGWKQDPVKTPAHRAKWVPDMLRDPFMSSMDTTFIFWHLGLGLAMYGAGYAFGGWWMALSWLTWGMFLRLVVVLHGTWLVNSACHLWGYRNHDTADDSRNNPFVAAITYGEGWHNNHHALPRRADHGMKWWEIDLTYRTILLMEKVGLAWNVHDRRKERAGKVARPGKQEDSSATSA